MLISLLCLLAWAIFQSLSHNLLSKEDSISCCNTSIWLIVVGWQAKIPANRQGRYKSNMLEWLNWLQQWWTRKTVLFLPRFAISELPRIIFNSVEQGRSLVLVLARFIKRQDNKWNTDNIQTRKRQHKNFQNNLHSKLNHEIYSISGCNSCTSIWLIVLGWLKDGWQATIPTNRGDIKAIC